MDETYLSVIVTTRNDNHGGDLLKRTRTFFKGLLIQCNKFKIKSELIIVEWNPPADKPLLKDELLADMENRYVTVRYIVVPNEIHQQYKYKDTIPLYQMIAKNVGIRRAEGKFVLCTNIDILFSDELMEKIAGKELQENTFYRANRCDIPKEVMDIESLSGQLEYARKNIMIRHGKNPKHVNVTSNLPSWTYYFDSIAFVLDFLAKTTKKILWNKDTLKLNTLDFMACGDFTMMSKKDWLKIEGYVELDLYSLHVDSMALISAKSLGIEQKIFERSECTYHIHHKDGWTGFDNPVDMVRFLLKRPSIDWYTIGSSGEHLIKTQQNWGINKEDWGFANEDFQEYRQEPDKA